MDLKGNIRQERRHDIDWLRIFATFMIFFFHCARFFDYMRWHVKNDDIDLCMTIFVVFVAGWIMPLFFLLSGMSIYYSLEVRESRDFIKERSKRLIIPYIFGLFIILAPQAYFEYIYWNNYSGSFIEFYFLHYLTGGILKFGIFIDVQDKHLWYLFWLFILSLITLPLFRYLRKEEIKEKILKIAQFCNKPGALFLLSIPIIIAQIIGEIIPIFGNFAGWSIFCYLTFFIIGYILASNIQFKKAIEKHGLVALIIGITTSIIIIVFLLPFIINIEPIFGMPKLNETISMFLFVFLCPLNGFCWLIVILNIGSKYLNRSHKSLGFLNDIILPFYILHQTLIIVIGWYIINLDLIIILKYIIISSISFIIIIALVLIIRKSRILRFLFGMKLKKKSNKITQNSN